MSIKPNSERKQEKRERRAERLRNISSQKTKKELVELAQKAWNDENEQGQVSFAPSVKLLQFAVNFLEHGIGEVFITAGDIRHIKKKHSSGEVARGQIDIKPEHFAELYDVINEFDIAEIGDTDKQGNKSIRLIKGYDGATFSAITERGRFKAEIKTFYKRKKKKVSPVSDALHPEQNTQSDPVPSSSDIDLNIA